MSALLSLDDVPNILFCYFYFYFILSHTNCSFFEMCNSPTYIRNIITYYLTGLAQAYTKFNIVGFI